MLPDFPVLKETLTKRMLRNFEAKRAEATHVFNEVPKIMLHEGRRLIITLEDGTEREVELKHISVESSISHDDYSRLTPSDIGRRIEEAAVEMAKKQLDLAYKELDQAVTSVGNVVHAGGKPLSPEHILKALEIMQIDFDASGRPKLPTIVIHPDQFDQWKRVLGEIESDPDLSRRNRELFATKKEEWLARESNRKLVG
jgi:hypothetical protein